MAAPLVKAFGLIQFDEHFCLYRKIIKIGICRWTLRFKWPSFTLYGQMFPREAVVFHHCQTGYFGTYPCAISTAYNASMNSFPCHTASNSINSTRFFSFMLKCKEKKVEKIRTLFPTLVSFNVESKTEMSIYLEILLINRMPLV